MTPEQERRYKFTTTVAVVAVAVSVMSALFAAFRSNAGFVEVAKVKATLTVVVASLQATKGPSASPMPAATTKAPAATVTRTRTPAAPTATRTSGPTASATAAPVTFTPSAPGATFTPWPAAPLCQDVGEFHNLSLWHGIWNAAAGCHYDHEHGENAFTADARTAFGGLDFQTLLGAQIGSTNPSSPCENVIGVCGPSVGKHGGFKLQAELDVPHPCAVGFEGATVGVKRALIQYHAFGNYAIEFESRIHSAAILLAQCLPSNPNDVGYVFTIQHQEYGQRTSPYQGRVLDYPDNFQPAYASGFAPYFTIDPVGDCTGARPSLEYVISRNLNAASKWTSKPSGRGARPETSLVFRLLFDVRDTYQLIDCASIDDGYPYIFRWLCGDTAYNPAGCRYNNSTSTVHEIAGDVPPSWDNLAGWDTDTRVGRVTADGFVSRFGMPVAPGSCLIPGLACFPVKLVSAFVGRWGADLCAVKCSVLTVANSPEHDVYFCAGRVCKDTDAGAVPSGWIGPNN